MAQERVTSLLTKKTRNVYSWGCNLVDGVEKSYFTMGDESRVRIPSSLRGRSLVVKRENETSRLFLDLYLASGVEKGYFVGSTPIPVGVFGFLRVSASVRNSLRASSLAFNSINGVCKRYFFNDVMVRLHRGEATRRSRLLVKATSYSLFLNLFTYPRMALVPDTSWGNIPGTASFLRGLY